MRKQYFILAISFFTNVLIGMYLLYRQNDSQEIDYNKINTISIVDQPNIAKNVADVYFEEFLKQKKAFDKRDRFAVTVMFDKDTCEWVAVYIPIYDMPLTQLSSGPADYSYEVRVRKDHGMVRITDYDFSYYLY